MSSGLNRNAKNLEKFEIIQWNCRGFRAWKKRSHLQLYLQSLGDMPALLALQEPGMDAKFSGYSTFQGGPSTCILENEAYPGRLRLEHRARIHNGPGTASQTPRPVNTYPQHTLPPTNRT